MDKVGAFQIYNGEILSMRKEGRTLQDIGDTVGVSRQRVKQIMDKRWPQEKVQLPTTCSCVKRLGISCEWFEKIAKQLGLSPHIFSVYRIWNPEAYNSIKEYLENRKCGTCGAKLSVDKRVYCSHECYLTSVKHINRSDKSRERHKFLVKRWRRTHPKEFREIQQRADKTYWQKKRLSWRFIVLNSRVIPVGSIVTLDPDRKAHAWFMYVIWEGKSYRVGKRWVKRIGG